MVRGIFSSASGMQYLQLKQEVTANNIANINTTGFKKQGVFRSTLSDRTKLMNQHASDFVNLEEVDEARTIHTPGSFSVTNNPLDIAIDGTAFLTVQTPGGPMYTRNGNLTVGSDGTLQTTSGHSIQGLGGPIQIFGDKIFIADDGQLFVDDVVQDQLQLVTFNEPWKLTRETEGLYSAEPGTAAPALYPDSKILQGALEESNVLPIDEMVKMIQISRNFEAGQKALSMQDETLRRAVNDVGRVRS